MLQIQEEITRLAKLDIRFIGGSGAPTDGTAGTGVGNCGPGSVYTDIVTGFSYVNYGTKASPVWGGSATQGIKGELVTTQSFTIAQINAGATLLPALAGLKYQVTDWAMISVGGAAAGATTVDILATQGAGSVKLAASAVAGLTQNALLRAGAANAAILAGGASFAVNDVNTAITVNKTGANLTTSVTILFIVRYFITA